MRRSGSPVMTAKDGRYPSWSSSKWSFTAPLVRRNFAQSNIVAPRSITEASKLISGFLKRNFFFLRVPGWLAARL